MKTRTLVVLVILGIPVALVVLVVLAFAYRNTLVVSAVEQAGTYALGTETSLASANLDFNGESLTLNRLEIANPRAYQRDHFMTLHRGYFELEVGSVFDDTVRIPTLQFDSLSLELSRHDGAFNFQAILDSIQRFQVDESASDDGQYLVQEITVTGVAADIVLLPEGGDLTKAGLAIDQIHITNLGGRTRTLPELAATLVSGILTGVTQAGGGLPDQVVAGLRSKLSAIKSDTEMQVAVSGVKSTGALSKVKGLMDDVIKGDGTIEDKIKDIGKGLLGGDKE